MDHFYLVQKFEEFNYFYTNLTSEYQTDFNYKFISYFDLE